MNVIRQIADARARSGDAAEPPTHTSTPGDAEENDSAPPLNANGTNYLLTARTLFTTHEPCIMCSMALLHSRVKEVVYLLPMRATGGCGGGTCVPALPGVNHRFGICRWTEDAVLEAEAGLQVDASVDA
jgi:tRNA-specific adenosine deaminase 3